MIRTSTAIDILYQYADGYWLMPDHIAQELYEEVYYGQENDNEGEAAEPLDKKGITVILGRDDDMIHFVPECRGFRIEIH
jgi:hypothetical protein